MDANSQQKHTRKNDTKNKFSANELPFTGKELKYQKPYKNHKSTEDSISKGGCSPFPWKLASAVLGVLCLLLTVVSAAIAVAVLTANSSSERASPTSPTSPTIQQKGPCYPPCPENWVWFRYSCYYFSKIKLTWEESRRACSSLNSSLVKINREEMNFFSLNSFFWVGVYYKEIGNQWLWENDSALSPDMFRLEKPQIQKACLSYQSKEAYGPGKCEEKQNYICKKRLIYPMKPQ